MKNPYTATSLEADDTMAYTIKLHIGHVGEDGTLYIGVYKCPWDSPEIGEDGSPQGMKINPPIEMLHAIFPILANYEAKYF